MQKKIEYYLVAGDRDPDLRVRFKGLDLSTYGSISMNIELDDGSRFSRTVTPDGTDAEVGTVSWEAGDLVPGTHLAEFVFTTSGKSFRLPRIYPVSLIVRVNHG